MSESSAQKSTKDSTTADPELDDLLDSALQDFENSKSSSSIQKAENPTLPAGETNWDEEFLSQAKLFDERMAALFKEAGVNDVPSSADLSAGLAKMAEAASKVYEGKDLEPVEPSIVDSITQALKGLKEGSENIQSFMDPDEMANLFGGININAAAEESNPFMPFVQGMMQSLLSAEVLLPSLKELLEKYPTWLDENKDKLSAEDRERYVKQQELFRIVINELESEKADDPVDVKTERFKRVLEHMQKLHEYGQPPVDLIGGEQLAGMPQMPPLDDPSQCSIM